MRIIEEELDDDDFVNEEGATFIPDRDSVNLEDCGGSYVSGHRRPPAE